MMDELHLHNNIHPTAILEGNIRMGLRNTIGPNVVLRGNISLGDDNVLKAGVCFENNVTIGHQNIFYPFVTVGTLGEMGAKGDRLVEEGGVAIGNENTFREYVCIHSPVYSYETLIGSNVYVMNKSYIAHDCIIHDHVILSAGVLLGGRVEVGTYANLGMGVTVHQRSHIGAYAMCGMQTVVKKDILPFALVTGIPARIQRLNTKGAELAGMSEKDISEMEAVFLKGDFEKYITSNPIYIAVKEFIQSHPGALLQVK